MIELKTPDELTHMRRAGQIVAELLAHLAALVAPGLKTKELDVAARAFIKASGSEPAFLGYRGFPATICVSVNDEVVHGIPGERVLKAGDVVSIDAGVKVQGLFSDAALTVPVGRVSAQAQRLIDATRQSLDEAIAMVQPTNRLSDISHAVQQSVEREGFGVVRDFVGHGIGRALHEEPPIPNYGAPHMGPRLHAGMVLAIEPMVTMGRWDVNVLDDGWTAVTRDGSLAAHFEHTVAVTEHGPEVLTRVNERAA